MPRPCNTDMQPPGGSVASKIVVLTSTRRQESQHCQSILRCQPTPAPPAYAAPPGLSCAPPASILRHRLSSAPP
eukprot:scaffold119993_cov63-Phaeocystis_antarctica.AAC.1